MSANMIASFFNAVLWASEMYGSGAAGNGCWRACMRSCEALTASSIDDRYVIYTLVGNYCKVSVILVDFVS